VATPLCRFISPQALGDGSAYAAPTDLQKFDTTLRSLVNASKLITPDDIRLQNATLRQAVFPPSQWPTIADLRDKIMFVADPGYIKGASGDVKVAVSWLWLGSALCSASHKWLVEQEHAAEVCAWYRLQHRIRQPQRSSDVYER